MNESLTHADKATYLANVLSVAKSDGIDTQEEAVAFQAIAKRLGAEQRHFMAAKRLLDKGSYSLGYVRSRQQRMANVQDMVMIALADGTIVDSESKPIEGFAAQLQISQGDMDMLVERARAELDRVLAEAGEPRSSQPLDSPGLTASPPAPPPLPADELELPPEPPAPEAPATPEPDEIEKQEPPEEIRVIMAEASAVEACIRAHDASEEPRSYCFGAGSGSINPWGCRLAELDWVLDADWFELGEWRDDATFVFDRDAIREKLNANLEAARICPHLKERYVEAAIDALPAVASIWGRWQHRPARVSTPGARPVTVNQYLHGVSVSLRRIVLGVDPVGRREAIKLIVRAAKRSGTEPPRIELLASEQ
jgi:tellurite resistance protein